MAFDCDRFIIEIESRPAIWDSRCDEYANKCKKGKAWEEVCDMFVENFKAMDSVHKNKAAADLQRKWKNLRDCFRRELAKQRNCKSGSAADGRKQYIYFQQLTFLLPVCDTKPTTEESPDLHTQATPAAATSTAPTSLKRKKPSPETEELELLQSLRRNMEKRHAGREEEDSDRHFLLSLLPYFKRLPDDMKLEVQSDFLNTLRRYNQVSISGHRCPSQTSVYPHSSPSVITGSSFVSLPYPSSNTSTSGVRNQQFTPTISQSYNYGSHSTSETSQLMSQPQQPLQCHALSPMSPAASSSVSLQSDTSSICEDYFN
ncbi:uncharacterized protein LOC134528960 [Bacillus rossius redtenbacheri]|uniref:uncharacterized protein LOC134528960 n=1 Tax=Bacillus rossius redtenbacheri TaxID=93214 RepID=UPI002FDE534E